MKKTFYSLLIAVAFSLGSLCAYGAEATAQAIVLKLKGTASVVINGQTTPITVGDKLPQGATVVTGPDSTLDLQAFNGAVATIGSKSTIDLEKLSVTTSGGAVTKQTALLNLKVGSIVSNIDPANHKINDYGIRTPKGVAAARGTVFAVEVTRDADGNVTSVTVNVTQSTVTFTYVDSNGVTQSVPVTAGNSAQITVDPKTGKVTGVVVQKGTSTNTNTTVNVKTETTVDTTEIVSQAK